MGWPDLVDGMNTVLTDQLGIDVSHQPLAGGGPHSRRGIFGNAMVAVDQGTEVADVKSRPTLGIKVSDWSPKPVQRDRIIVNGTTYYVEELQEDGEGGAIVVMHK